MGRSRPRTRPPRATRDTRHIASLRDPPVAASSTAEPLSPTVVRLRRRRPPFDTGRQSRHGSKSAVQRPFPGIAAADCTREAPASRVRGQWAEAGRARARPRGPSRLKPPQHGSPPLRRRQSPACATNDRSRTAPPPRRRLPPWNDRHGSCTLPRHPVFTQGRCRTSPTRLRSILRGSVSPSSGCWPPGA